MESRNLMFSLLNILFNLNFLQIKIVLNIVIEVLSDQLN